MNPSLQPKPRRLRHSASFAIASMFAITGLLVGAFITGTLDYSPTSIAAVPQGSKELPSSQVGDLSRGFAHIIKSVRPAIVNITASASGKPTQRHRPNPFDHDPFGQDPNLPGWDGFPMPRFPQPPENPRGMGMGSGVIVSPDGYIVTNHHVIDRAENVSITLIDKREFTGHVIGTDPQTDLAVIKISGKNLPYIAWGDSSQLEIGEYVLAIGNPFGLNSTVTQGIVSGLGRGGMGITQYENFIQTDAAINPGNSGGALVNTRGELVGINTAILSRTGGNQGVGFAIPASMGNHVYKSLVQHGKVTRGYLGVGIQELTPDLATALQLKKPSGALVTDVKEYSPAAKAGVRQGDTIVQYQDLEITDPRSLQGAVTRTPVGDDAKVTVIRDGSEVVLTVIIKEHPDTQRVTAAHASTTEEFGLAGLKVTELTPKLASRLRLDEQTQGVVVEAVQPNSQPARAGLRPGDVISEINRQPVHSLDDYQEVMADLQPKQQTLILINRKGMTIYLTIKV